MAKAATKSPPPATGRWGALIISGMIATILFAIGVVAGWFYARLTAPRYDHPLSIVIYRIPHDDTIENHTSAAQPHYSTSYYAFEDTMTTNLLNSNRITQVKIAFGTTYDQSVWSSVDAHRLALRSALLAVLSATTEPELRTEDGKRKVQAGMRDAVNSVLARKNIFPAIETVHLTEVVIQ